MTQNKLLTKELVRHIFTSFGMTMVNTPNNTLLSKELLTSKTVKIKYDDDEEFTHSVFAGQLVLAKDSKFRAVIVNLSMDETQEYCCAFRLDKLPLHGLRLRYDDEDTGAFKVYDEANKSWIDASVEIQAMILGGVEKIISYGLLWEKTSEFDDLYKAAVNLAAPLMNNKYKTHLHKVDKLIDLSKNNKNICVDEEDYLQIRPYIKGLIGPVAPSEILVDALYGYFNSGAKFWVPNNSLCETVSIRRTYDTHPSFVRVSNSEAKRFKEIVDWSDEIFIGCELEWN